MDSNGGAVMLVLNPVNDLAEMVADLPEPLRAAE